jgi:hypothetical protein
MTRAQLADITAVIGGTGTGKTFWMRQELRRRAPHRLMVWDPEGDLADLGVSVPSGQLASLVQLTEGERWAIVYNPPFDRELAERAFNTWCRLAFKRAEQGRAPLLLVDELSTVVRAGSAPAYWTACVSRGRKRGLSIMAASQRPARIDKDFWSQANRIRCSALGYEADQKAMAAALGRPLLDVQNLHGFEAIERDRNRPARASRTTSA